MSERDYELDALLRELEERYSRPEIPPCSVCGDELTMAASGPGPAVFACSGMEADPDNPDRVRYKEGRSVADDHYSKSRIEVPNLGDSRVLALIEEVRRLRSAPEDAPTVSDVEDVMHPDFPENVRSEERPGGSGVKGVPMRCSRCNEEWRAMSDARELHYCPDCGREDRVSVRRGTAMRERRRLRGSTLDGEGEP